MPRCHTSGRGILTIIVLLLLLIYYRQIEDAHNESRRSWKRSEKITSDHDKEYAVKPVENLCVSVLTGYPDVARKEYVVRLLHNIQNITNDITIDLHVFCQGPCEHTLLDVYAGDAVYHETNATVHMDVKQERQRAGDIFHDRRWFYLSTNYYFMLHELFTVLSYRHCLLLEDDLLIASDAFHYASAGRALMNADPSIFSVSLYNDNGVPLFYRDNAAFRRVSHFSGLGFLMSHDVFKTHLEKQWPKYLPWDKFFQKKFQNKNLVSIQPHVTRSLHIVDKTISSTSDCHFQHESRILNNVILNKYDLTYLMEDRYDSYIVNVLKSAVIVEYIEDSILVDGTALFLSCSDKAELSSIVSGKHLEGLGNGKIVRGSYRGMLMMNYGDARLLIVCKSSPFRKLIPSNLHTFTPSANTKSQWTDLQRGIQPVARNYMSYVTYLKEMTIVVSERNQSCAAACEIRSLHCDPSGLWLLTEHCSVLRASSKDCDQCDKFTSESHPDSSITGRRHPAVMYEGRCLLGNPLFNNCFAATHQYARICVCRYDNS